ncbi:MAG: cytosolic protein [Desulfobacteraceae bacterium]|nr:cytosolic protein [Desulfobacteraceae bacterium]
MTQRDDYDSPWKDILGEYFEQFMYFFFPKIAEEIDWKKGYEPADKELRQITREAEIGKRFADRLFRVWKKNGEEMWVMVHVEVQAQKETGFTERTFTYNYRIRDLYNCKVVSLAVLADDNETWYPSVYLDKLWGCLTLFRFPTVKILEYRKQWEQLEKSDNPFAAVVMAHLKTMETKGDDSRRKKWKLELTKNLYRQGFEKQDIINLYRFIDWIMVLPKELEGTYHQELMEFEEKKKMKYITTAERIGIEKGEHIGIEKGERIGIIKTAENLLSMGVLTNEQIVQATGLTLKDIQDLQKTVKHGNA